jgi:hypothetical protein
MLDAIRRFFVMLFGHPQPIDFWLLAADLAIVVLIIWLDVPEKLHKRKVNRYVVTAVVLMQEGEVIEAAVPRAGPIENADIRFQETISIWCVSVNEWESKASKFLANCSPKAGAAFVHHVGATGMLYGGVTGSARDQYEFLLARMNNLRNIIEKADAYF